MLKLLWDALFGGTLTSAGDAIANASKWAALVAMVPAIWHWYEQHGADVAVTFTWSQVIFVAGILFAIIQTAHSARRDA